jgi:hypothetical protein
MLRMTSKRVKEVVNKPAVVRLSRSLWDDARYGKNKAKRQFILRQIAAMTAWCRITAVTTFELPRCEMKGQDAEILECWRSAQPSAGAS